MLPLEPNHKASPAVWWMGTVEWVGERGSFACWRHGPRVISEQNICDINTMSWPVWIPAQWPGFPSSLNKVTSLS